MPECIEGHHLHIPVQCSVLHCGVGSLMPKPEHQHLYNGPWRKERLHFLDRNPLCSYCAEEGRVTAAEVVDHIIPHRGDPALFWDITNWQPLCKWCHDSVKQREEKSGPVKRIGPDGWPVN